MRERRKKKTPPYQIVKVDMEGNTVRFPEPSWDLKQLPIPIFGNQDVFILVPNENSHLFPIVQVPLQQTVGNVPLQNMDVDEAPFPEFEEMDGNDFFEQTDQETEVAPSKQINNGGDDTGEEGQVLHPPTN